MTNKKAKIVTTLCPSLPMYYSSPAQEHFHIQIEHKNSKSAYRHPSSSIGSPFPHVPPVLQVYRHLGVGDSCEAQKFSDTCVEKLRTLSKRDWQPNDTLERHWPTPVRPNVCLQIASSPLHLVSRHMESAKTRFHKSIDKIHVKRKSVCWKVITNEKEAQRRANVHKEGKLKCDGKAVSCLLY